GRAGGGVEPLPRGRGVGLSGGSWRGGRAAVAAVWTAPPPPGVNSGWGRARAQLARALPDEEELAEPAEPDRRALLERFAAAFENADVNALVELLRGDVTLEMPPLRAWFAGRQGVVPFFAATAVAAPGQFRLVPVTANGQPAFAVYQRERDEAYKFYGVTVPTATATGIARIVTFFNPGLFRSFGLPPEYGTG